MKSDIDIANMVDSILTEDKGYVLRHEVNVDRKESVVYEYINTCNEVKLERLNKQISLRLARLRGEQQ